MGILGRGRGGLLAVLSRCHCLVPPSLYIFGTHASHLLLKNVGAA